MGEIEKPWNCPHGRPTMRHLTGLEGFGGWREGAGLADEDKDGRDGGEDEDEKWVWERYARA
jgi:DNA mismatch repair protein PMS2